MSRKFNFHTAILILSSLGYKECGNLERGFARIRCDHCEHEYLLAFSCKSRWFCPSCHQKNVQTTARFILEHVLAAVPHRHYVLAIPKMLRPYFQRHRPLLKRLCTLAHQRLAEYLRTALGCPKGVPGIIEHTATRCAACATEGCHRNWWCAAQAFRHHRP